MSSRWTGAAPDASDAPRKAGGARVGLYQLMGQDSLEANGAQHALRDAHVQHSLKGRTLVVYPRTTQPAAACANRPRGGGCGMRHSTLRAWDREAGRRTMVTTIVTWP